MFTCLCFWQDLQAGEGMHVCLLPPPRVHHAGGREGDHVEVDERHGGAAVGAEYRDGAELRQTAWN